MINIAALLAIFFSCVGAQLQAKSCSISCPGDPTFSSLRLDNEQPIQAGPPGKRGVIGPPGRAGAPGGMGSKGEKGEAFNSKVLEDEIAALRNSITELKRLALVGGWSEASNGHWYKLFRNKMDFNEARALCKKYGTSLAHVGMKTLTAIREVASLVGIKGEDQAWIGATDIAQEGTWVWEDGSTDPVVNWYPGEPNNSGSNEHCAQFSTQQKFNDATCKGHRIGAFCETEQL